MVANRIQVKLFASSPNQLKYWKEELVALIESALSAIGVEASTDMNSPGDLVFISDQREDYDEILEKQKGQGKAIILITQDSKSIPKRFLTGEVDDVLVEPLRKIEILSKLKSYQEILRWDEVQHMNQSFSSVVLQLKEDLELAERLQQNKLPKRWPKFQGFKAHSRYLAGLKSGGDYFDVIESKDRKSLGVFLSDASSYGLSSTVLGSFLKVATKVSLSQKMDSLQVIKNIEDELLQSMGEDDEVSLFFGLVSKKNFSLNYLHLGDAKVILFRKGEGIAEIPSQGFALSKKHPLKLKKSKSIKLQPSDRLIFLSDGVWHSLNDQFDPWEWLREHAKKGPKNILNEVAYHVKASLKEDDALPVQDCTALVLDVESNVVKLKKTG